ncbi:MAG TPA: nicotinate (nicotinamide) nucleotide adenylyltransferase [Leptolyngbyaceae cyanobacterium M33_DOE_097]|uniref:Probable nicotinate-nucleotide adenylyltransferase n=1 Tax=Oscillatoriales cyanobacterium SpSt-418 TaxID=2282169 RepID=A0A7C3PG77_9CYAN|nr:nicotinate (nicotinamide) nucleotide adenylyltransferase [Leptolyngbyaceae cyanobacterium M33_DOE_097]
MRKLAIFGGTFDPVHWGHLLIAETAWEQAELDQVIWVPAANPPHKPELCESFAQRLEMVRRAIADQPAFIASDIDQHQAGRSYAIETLVQLQQHYPQSDWYWILGDDAFKSLPRWRQAHQLIEQCTWLIAPRVTELAHPASTVALNSNVRQMWLKMPQIGVSSSQVRDRVAQQKSIRYLVPESVRLYIESQKLYTK